MPFKRLKNGKYKSPTGRILSKKQLTAYYARQRAKGKKK
jgi:hypothetical protein